MLISDKKEWSVNDHMVHQMIFRIHGGNQGIVTPFHWNIERILANQFTNRKSSMETIRKKVTIKNQGCQ